MPTLRPWLSRMCCSLLLSLLAAIAAPAQYVSDANQNLPPYGGFGGGQFDTVSLQNGNLHLHIPIGSWQQRGGKTAWVALEYDSAAWSRQTTITVVNGVNYHRTILTGIPNTGLRLSGNVGGYSVQSGTTTAYCSYLNSNINEYLSWVVLDPEGVQHPVSNLRTYQTICPGFATSVTKGPTDDGSGMVVNIGTNPMLTLKDGTRIPLTGSNSSFSGTSIEDTNGNLYTSTDTLGRTNVTVTNGSGYTIYTVHDSLGNPQSYRVDFTTISMVTNFCGTLNNPPYHTCNEYNYPNASVPSKITLPNGTTYQFFWNNNTAGQLSSVVLPSKTGQPA